MQGHHFRAETLTGTHQKQEFPGYLAWVCHMICNHFREVTASKITSHFFSGFKWSPGSVFLHRLPSKRNSDSTFLGREVSAFPLFQSRTHRPKSVHPRKHWLFRATGNLLGDCALRHARPEPGPRAFLWPAQSGLLMPRNSFTDPSRVKVSGAQHCSAGRLHYIWGPQYMLVTETVDKTLLTRWGQG